MFAHAQGVDLIPSLAVRRHDTQPSSPENHDFSTCDPAGVSMFSALLITFSSTLPPEISSQGCLALPENLSSAACQKFLNAPL